ncbi:MAG: CAP domain-containing protein [Lachnospiraceae bacterium]|nr:CAP domain-containing protein [Lachnospiraceae bacterium]MDY5742790.1 CAP domain-containing protein [Lachnospiraceae bacterium]
MKCESMKAVKIGGIAVLLLFALAFLPIDLPTTLRSAAATPRQTDVTVPTGQNVLVSVEGRFSTAGKEKILARINAIRKEAADLKLVDRYVPLKWSNALEWIAQTRAAESSLMRDHARMSGRPTLDLTKDGIRGSLENLAWNYLDGEASMLLAIEYWYSEKADYQLYHEGKTPNGIIGHYQQLIDPRMTHTGLGTFRLSDSDAWTATAQMLGSLQTVNESQTGDYGVFSQVLEVMLRR